MFDKLYQPEYTGMNRCWSCTVVNLVILFFICLLVFIVLPPASVFVGAIGVILIWIRGYFVPFTPDFAPAIASALPFSFGGGKGIGSFSGKGDQGEAVSQLYDLDVLTGDGVNLELSDTFVKKWKKHAESLEELSDDELVARISKEAPTIEDVRAVEKNGETWIKVSVDSRPMTRAVAVAELSALLALKEFTNIGPRSRVEAAKPLRTFLDFCPNCSGTVERRKGGHDSEAAPSDADVLVCYECGEVFHIYDE